MKVTESKAPRQKSTLTTLNNGTWKKFTKPAEIINVNPNTTAWRYIDPIYSKQQAPTFRRLDNAIHRINHYPLDKCKLNKTTLSTG